MICCAWDPEITVDRQQLTGLTLETNGTRIHFKFYHWVAFWRTKESVVRQQKGAVKKGEKEFNEVFFSQTNIKNWVRQVKGARTGEKMTWLCQKLPEPKPPSPPPPSIPVFNCRPESFSLTRDAFSATESTSRQTQTHRWERCVSFKKMQFWTYNFWASVPAGVLETSLSLLMGSVPEPRIFDLKCKVNRVNNCNNHIVIIRAYIERV